MSIYQLKNKIKKLIGNEEMPYCEIKNIKSFDGLTIINNNTQSECVSGIMYGAMPVYWAFIKENQVLGAWCKYWDDDTMRKNRDMSEDAPLKGKGFLTERNDWNFWLDPNSPFTPILKDESVWSNERGEQFDGQNNIEGYIDTEFDYNNCILYVEYKCPNDELCGEIYTIIKGDTDGLV